MKQHICESCKRDALCSNNIFLCKGLLVCRECFYQATRNNTIAFDEGQYKRKVKE